MKTRIVLLAAVSWCLADSTSFATEPLHILVMAPTTAALELPKYEALSGYLKSVNPLLGDIKVRVAEDYPAAPAGSIITELGVEREGLRGDWLSISAKMGIKGGSEEEGMAGVYLTRVPTTPRR